MMIKFTILIPTRDRLDLLLASIRTVQKQTYHNWEVIVSDNSSESSAEDSIVKVNDARIRYFKTDGVLPVTDNWNNALKYSTGDYILMLGDDDGLLSNYLSRANDIINSNIDVELIYHCALLFAYPGALETEPNGYLRSYQNRKIYKSRTAPFQLLPSEAKSLALASLDFQMKFDYNMQFFLVKNSLIQKIVQSKENFYKSPYPDYFAANLLMMRANRIMIDPIPSIVIGISKKSFGHYYFNNNEKQGQAFLKNIPDDSLSEKLKAIVHPGSNMNDSWLYAMELFNKEIQADYPAKINYKNYRKLQIIYTISENISQEKYFLSELIQNYKHLFIYEKFCYSGYYIALALLYILWPKARRKGLANRVLNLIIPNEVTFMPNMVGTYNDMDDVFNKIDFNTHNG
jgi:glycosyltransferase involved in cell wall biosynthesis